MVVSKVCTTEFQLPVGIIAHVKPLSTLSPATILLAILIQIFRREPCSFVVIPDAYVYMIQSELRELPTPLISTLFLAIAIKCLCKVCI